MIALSFSHFPTIVNISRNYLYPISPQTYIFLMKFSKKNNGARESNMIIYSHISHFSILCIISNLLTE